MSDSKRATLITVGATKSAKNNVNKTVRLTINLYESNESKYPELNYKELVIAEERKKKQENGKTAGLDPFSDNDDDVERVARKFEQKYGGKSTYGKKGRSKVDDFADIGAGYDENDSFIDNTDGYDEMIPPECDTLYGGFYINSGELEFKAVPENQLVISDAEPGGNRKNKRRISSSSSDDSSESSSETSPDEKEKPVANGTVDSHESEHRKKKNKKIEKKKGKKKQRTDSSAANSGKQTSDDNGHGDGESVDSRTSQSDSLTSKPAPSSENAVTSDSSRDAEHNKAELKLPPIVAQTLDECESLISRQRQQNPAITSAQLQEKLEPHLFRLDRALQKPHADIRTRRIAWTRVAKALKTSRATLLQKVKQMSGDTKNPVPQTQPSTIVTAHTTTTNNNKRKAPDNSDDFDVSNMTEEEKEAKIVETLKRLKALIDERTPGMMANYNAECERVQEERKKIQIASAAEGAPHIEKRLPKRRFPWCGRSRTLLLRLRNLCDSDSTALLLLTNRALPLFPHGFVRLPTLLRQADLSKELKAVDVKRQRVGSVSQQNRSQSVTQPPPNQPFTEPLQFPASLTVTTTVKTSPEKNEIPAPNDKEKKSNSVFGSILNSFSLSKDLLVETDERRKESEKKEDLYIPPNSIGSITITPVPNQKSDKKTTNAVVENKHKEPLLRVKSPAALNEMVNNKDFMNNKKDKEKQKKSEKSHSNVKEKRVNSPLHIDTSYQSNKKDPSPKTVDEVTKKQIESMRTAESNIPRPALVPVHNSPTFAKPDKRPPEVKKKKDIVIVSDVDPLAEVPNDPVAIDDSSSDVELIEDSKNTDKVVNNDVVPSKDLVNNKKDSNQSVSDKSEQLDEAIKDDIDIIMRNIREMEHSQEPTKMNSFGGVIASAKHEASTKLCMNSRPVFQESRSGRDKLTNFFEQNGWM